MIWVFLQDLSVYLDQLRNKLLPAEQIGNQKIYLHQFVIFAVHVLGLFQQRFQGG